MSRSEIEMIWLDEYINWIVNYFDINRNYEKIILCWGYTNPKEIISESESFREILFKKFKEKNISIPLFTENTSFITYENFVFWILSIRNLNITNVLIVADEYRKTKVETQAKILFEPVGINTDFLFLPRRDNHPNSDFHKQTYEILPKDIADQKFIKLKDFFHEVMKK